jgi:hypothetical protein
MSLPFKVDTFESKTDKKLANTAIIVSITFDIISMSIKRVL